MLIGPIGTGQKMLVICVRWRNVATARLANAADWVSLLDSQVNGFYNRASYGQTNFSFELAPGGPTSGWFDFGHGDGNITLDLGQRAVTLADPHVDFSNYHRVIVITNWPDFGGKSAQGPWRVSSGAEQFFLDHLPGSPVVDVTGMRAMTLSIVHEWQARASGEPYDAGAAVAAHEIGHQLDVQTHYSDFRWAGVGRESITPWDVMGKSPFQRHFLGWAKADRGWLGSARVATVAPGSGLTTVRLKPLEAAKTIGTQLVKVPFTMAPGPFVGLAVENRQQTDGDEPLPKAGVLLSLIDEHPEVVYGMKGIVLATEPTQNLALAALGVGGSYHDAERSITVSVASQTGSDYDVQVDYPSPPLAPDAFIRPWGAPPWETPDIWIDSEKNGWDTYRYTDDSGQPVGNGDDAWVNHANRVYARVHNAGPGVASDVRVQMYVNSPPGMGDAGPNWDYLGTIVFPSIAAGADAQDFVSWTPTEGTHTCIRAVIDSDPNELTTANNRAQENVTHFDTSAGSPFDPVTLEAHVFNPFKAEDTEAYILVSGVPRSWAVFVDPPELKLPAGGSAPASVTIYPSGVEGMKTNEGEQRVGFVGRVGIEARVPYADTFVPVGGVDMWVRLTERTELTCSPRRLEEGLLVQGRLIPPTEGAIVVIEHRSGRKQQLEHVRTGADGEYRALIRGTVKAPAHGTVQAFFPGDDTHAPSESPKRWVPDA
jgi:M6 family metalloprotease-like protein